MMRIIAALLFVAALSGCATPAERTSPCACNWQPVNDRSAEGFQV